MPELQRLDLDHAPALLDFELANRAYFAASISDRGDDYFEHFTEGLRSLLAEQEAGQAAFHVVIAEDGVVLGRFNLLFLGDGIAELGFRVARAAAGQGLATATVRELCQTALGRYDLVKVRAASSMQNLASRAVLTKAGFVPVGPADPEHLGGKPGTWFERSLVDGPRVGALCFGCRLPIGADEPGLLVPDVFTIGADGSHPVAAWHRSCFRART